MLTDYTKAVAAADQAIERDPKIPEYYSLRAEILAAQDKWDAVVEKIAKGNLA